MNSAPVGMSTGSTPSSAKTGTAPAKGIDTQGPDKIKPGMVLKLPVATT